MINHESYRESFKSIEPEDAMVKNLISKANTAKRPLRRRAFVFAAAATAVLSVIAVSAKVIYDRGIVGTIIEADPADVHLSELVESAEQPVGISAVDGNIKMTVDKVLSDNYGVYALISFETEDGAPLADTVYDDFFIHRNNTVLDNVETGGAGISGISLRTDDGSDPSRGQFAIYDCYTSSFVKGVTGAVIEITGIDVTKESGRKADPGFTAIARGDWKFHVSLNNTLPEKTYNIDCHGNDFAVTVTPLTLSYSFGSGIFFGHDVRDDDDPSIELVMKDGTAADTGGAGGGMKGTRVTWTRGFTKIIDVDNIDMIVIDGERFPL